MADAIKIFVGDTASGATAWDALEGVTEVIPMMWGESILSVRTAEIVVIGFVRDPAPAFDKLYAAYQAGTTHECKVIGQSKSLAGPFFVTARTEPASAGVRRYSLNLYAAGAMTEEEITD